MFLFVFGILIGLFTGWVHMYNIAEKEVYRLEKLLARLKRK